MKSATESASSRNRPSLAKSLALTLIVFFGFSSIALGQAVIGSVQSEPQPTTTASQTDSPAAGATAINSTGGDLRWGPFNFRPHVAYRYLYGTGIQATPGKSKATSVHSIAPGVAAELGSHWTMDATSTWSYYSSKEFRDTVNQSLQINWSTKYEDWTLSAAQNYNRSDSPLIETGSQTKQTSYITNFNALYGLNGHYAFETGLAQNLYFTEGYTDTRTWSIREMLHQLISTRLDNAVGASYSYTAMNRKADFSNLQFLANSTWRPVDKLYLSLEAGVENTRSYNQTATKSKNPTYSASIQYTPTTTTQLGFAASKGTTASFLNSQSVNTRRYAFSLNQRILEHYRFSASYSRQDSEYGTRTSSEGSFRKDKVDTIDFQLRTTIRTRITTGISYEYSRNLSNARGFEFTSDQYGFDISYSF